MRQIATWAIGALLVLCLLEPGVARASNVNLSILYTGDTHGHLRSFYYDSSKPVGGIAKRAIYFQEKRRHQKMVWLTLDAGDALSGTPLSDVFQGYLDIAAMNRLRYDAMVLGVHEFDYGVDILRQRMNEAEFPVLAANVSYSDTGQPFTEPYVILDRNGVRVAILGLTTGDLGRRVAPEHFPRLTVADPVETARQLVPQLKAQSDVLVALTHLGINEDIRLASQVPGIDVIVGGMSHAELQVPMKVGETLIVHDAAYGRTVGLLKLSFAKGVAGGYQRVYFDSLLEPMAGKWVENTDYVQWLDGFQPQLTERMGLLVGTGASHLSNRKTHSSETALGNYVCDILREKTGADVALLPAAFFVDNLPEGPITLGDLYTAFPYDHYAVAVTVTGGELKEILDDAANQVGKPGFPQVSGVSFGILFGRAEQRTIRIAGRELEPFSQYQLATSDVLADGDLGYAALGTIADVRYSGRLIRDIVRERLVSGQVASSTLYSRITFLAEEPTTLATTPPTPGQPTTTTPPVEETSAPAGTFEGPAHVDETAASAAPPDEALPPEGDAIPAESGTPDFIPDTPEEGPPAGPPAETSPVTPESAPPDTPGLPTEGATPPEPPDDGEDDGIQPEEHVGLDTLRYDRTGQPLDQPVVIEDEVVVDPASAGESPAEPTAVEESGPPVPTAGTPPESPLTTTPAETPDDAATGIPASGGSLGTLVGEARTSNNDLEYSFRLIPTADGYEYQLQITNTTQAPVELTYDTGSRFDFIVYSGTDTVWNYNHNRFYLQSPQTDTLAPGELVTFRGKWDGLANDRTPLGGRTYRFEAVHEVRGTPTRMGFDALLPQ